MDQFDIRQVHDCYTVFSDLSYVACHSFKYSCAGRGALDSCLETIFVFCRNLLAIRHQGNQVSIVVWPDVKYLDLHSHVPWWKLTRKITTPSPRTLDPVASSSAQARHQPLQLVCRNQIRTFYRAQKARSGNVCAARVHQKRWLLTWRPSTSTGCTWRLITISC